MQLRACATHNPPTICAAGAQLQCRWNLSSEGDLLQARSNGSPSPGGEGRGGQQTFFRLHGLGLSRAMTCCFSLQCGHDYSLCNCITIQQCNVHAPDIPSVSHQSFHCCSTLRFWLALTMRARNPQSAISG